MSLAKEYAALESKQLQEKYNYIESQHHKAIELGVGLSKNVARMSMHLRIIRKVLLERGIEIKIKPLPTKREKVYHV
jgi:hypothetical protein